MDESKAKRFSRWKRYRYQFFLLLTLLAVTLIMSLLSKYFLTWFNLRNVLDQSAFNIIISVGMVIVMWAGGIDLSVGAVAAFCGIIMAKALHVPVPVTIAVGLGLIVGIAIGCLNGLIVTWVGVNPFIVTLAMLSIFSGFGLVITKGNAIYNFPASFDRIGSGQLGLISIPTVICLLLIILVFVLMNYTKWGYHIASIGGNEEVVRRSAINISAYKISIYAICSLTAAIAGLTITAKMGAAEPLGGFMAELNAIATVVLGGTSLKGGRGSVIGTVIAGLLLGVIGNGLTILGLSSYFQQISIGVVILVATALSGFNSGMVTNLRRRINMVKELS